VNVNNFLCGLPVIWNIGLAALKLSFYFVYSLYIDSINLKAAMFDFPLSVTSGSIPVSSIGIVVVEYREWYSRWNFASILSESRDMPGGKLPMVHICTSKTGRST